VRVGVVQRLFGVENHVRAENKYRAQLRLCVSYSSLLELTPYLIMAHA
jgi:hypothetical protein